MNTAWYILGYFCLFISVVLSFVAAKKDKYLPLIISAILLTIAWFVLWSLE